MPCVCGHHRKDHQDEEDHCEWWDVETGEECECDYYREDDENDETMARLELLDQTVAQ